jgi:hypothetical protein
MTIDLAPVLDPLLQLLVAALLALGTIAIKGLADKFGLERDGQLAGFLEDALREGIRVAEKKLGARIDDADVEVQNRVAGEAADWAIENVPKAVKRLVPGGRQALVEKVRAYAIDLVGAEG